MVAGIIGFGLIGKQRASDIARLENWEVRYAFDPGVSDMRLWSERLGFQIATSAREIVDDDDVELVIIAVPHDLAVDYAVLALRAGKHVLLEKPLGRNTDEAQRVVDAAGDCLVEPGFNYRFYSGIRKAKSLMDSSAIGTVTHVRAVLGHGGRPGMENEWKTDKLRCGGGALLDPGIHMIDLFRYLFGELEEGKLETCRGFWNLEIEDNAFLQLSTKHGVYIDAHISISEWKSLFRLEIFGRDGAILIEGRSKSYGHQSLQLTPRWFWAKDQKSPQSWLYEEEADQSFYRELRAFSGLLSGVDQPELATLLDGYRAIQIVERLYNHVGVSVTL